jgi:ABC-type phosphate transport system substrate-binding protein
MPVIWPLLSVSSKNGNSATTIGAVDAPTTTTIITVESGNDPTMTTTTRVAMVVVVDATNKAETTMDTKTVLAMMRIAIDSTS